jgi:hypothetical protein
MGFSLHSAAKWLYDDLLFPETAAPLLQPGLSLLAFRVQY